MHWVAGKPGVTPFYCSNFCSALHQEMQGYIEIRPKGEAVAAIQKPSPESVADVAALMKR
jgi:nitrous-oxide reductase